MEDLGIKQGKAPIVTMDLISSTNNIIAQHFGTESDGQNLKPLSLNSVPFIIK